MRQPTLWLLLALLGIGSSVSSQTVSESVTVSVVEVPVYVTRNSGAVMKDLTKDDFLLTVNGKPHPIEYFDVLVNDTKAAAPVPTQEAATGEPATLQRRRLIVLLFDTQNSDPHILRSAREAAHDFVENAPAGDTFAVAVSRSTGIHFVVPFTSDRPLIRRAIVTLQTSKAGDAFQLALLDSERKVLQPRTAVPPPDAMRSGAENPFAAADVSERWSFAQSESAVLAEQSNNIVAAVEADRRTRQRELSLQNLGLLARSLAPLAGVKHVVLLSPGMTIEDPQGAFSPTTVGDFAASEAPLLQADGSPSPFAKTASPFSKTVVGGNAYPMSLIKQVHAEYRAAGVILNAVNFGNSAPWRTSNSSTMLVDPSRLLKDLTTDTGGVVTQNLTSLRDMESVTYVLGFRPPPSKKKENSIGVKVKNAPFGAVIRHRRSYSTEPRPMGADDEIFLADVIVNDIPQSGMTLDLDVQAKPQQATLVAQVPGIELLTHGKNGSTVMDVFFYVFDERDVVTTWKHVRVGLDHEKGREFLSANQYSLQQAFRLPPGKYSAKTLMRVVGTDITAFQREEFVVPAL
jgi:VWFA-related protein